MRMWALWRRLIYGVAFVMLMGLMSTGIYYKYLYVEPTCFDTVQNGEEKGVDCGGKCVRICAVTVMNPTVLWAEAFHATKGEHNAVAYVENKNESGAPQAFYTLALHDEGGLIAERKGVTPIPPRTTIPIFEGRIETGNRVPTRTELTFTEIPLWVPATIQNNQFVVENRSLKNADTLPRLDARVTNTSLVPAEDIEIVATIFDIKRNPLTSSRTVVPYFEPRSTKNIVFTWQEPIAKTIRSCEVPTDIVLAIDLSGSMNNDGGTPPEPISSVLKAASAFALRLNEQDQISLVTYATLAVTRENLTNEHGRVSEIIDALKIAPADETGGTNTGDALVRATEELRSERHNSNARKVVVLLTDGLANEPDVDPEVYALAAAETLKGTGAEVYTIGLGSELNETFLRSIATDSDHYFSAGSSATIDRIYKNVTSALCEDGAAIIEITPKPKTDFAPLQ